MSHLMTTNPNVKKLIKDRIIFDFAGITFEKGLNKVFTNYFLPLYRNYEKDPNMHFEKSLLEYLESQQIRNDGHVLVTIYQ